MLTTITNQDGTTVKLDATHPAIADFSADDYVAESFTLKSFEDEIQQPFLIAETKDVTLKVETWAGDVLKWKFTRGIYNMPLRKILTDVDNTVTSCQVVY